MSVVAGRAGWLRVISSRGSWSPCEVEDGYDNVDNEYDDAYNAHGGDDDNDSHDEHD